MNSRRSLNILNSLSLCLNSKNLNIDEDKNLVSTWMCDNKEEKKQVRKLDQRKQFGNNHKSKK